MRNHHEAWETRCSNISSSARASQRAAWGHEGPDQAATRMGRSSRSRPVSGWRPVKGYLLDTNVALVALTEPADLSPAVRTAILTGPNVLSVVSYWEVL